MGITELHGVGPAMAQRLDAAGFRTVEAIAQATIDELTDVPGVGQILAARLRAEAQGSLGAELSAVTGERARAANVARSVKRLRRAIPDLAKSKKEAKRLKTATQRLAGWVDDLGRRPVRRQFLAEVTKINDEAKKRTGSKKDARALREHATRIEDAVRKVG
jgi:transcription termination factor NusA